jgi:alkanesulfonate monooxygenase SsuD/methylene tetrahydromethanopterin reductase-like flavin-dependent oxidoreductase (luciferase family)
MSTDRFLEFYFFNFGSHPDVPHADETPRRSLYIDLPNEYYDPHKGQWVLDSYLDTLLFGEKLGFDGICTTTQMGGPIGITPSSLLPAAYLAARTERIKIACLGPILNTYLSPMRAAEDIALLDNMSGGRIILGLPMGHGQNWHAAGGMNPAYARERHWEAHDLMVKAFTEPGPFEWVGKHYHVPYANLWPRPIQKPYPEVWIPAAGSRITFERCAQHRYTYQTLFSPRKALKRNITAFRRVTEEHGYTAEPRQVAVVLFVHVAETDKQARLEAEPWMLWTFQNMIRANRYDAFPPGHFSVESLRGFMTGGGYRARDIGDMTWEELVDEGWAVMGSPETVVEQLEEVVDDLGAGRVVVIADNGAMPNWMIRKSMTLMAEQVIPHFRPPGGAPIWAREDPRPVPTHAQLGADLMNRELPAHPVAEMPDGRKVDVRTSHVADLREQTEEKDPA